MGLLRGGARQALMVKAFCFVPTLDIHKRHLRGGATITLGNVREKGLQGEPAIRPAPCERDGAAGKRQIDRSPKPSALQAYTAPMTTLSSRRELESWRGQESNSTGSVL